MLVTQVTVDRLTGKAVELGGTTLPAKVSKQGAVLFHLPSKAIDASDRVLSLRIEPTAAFNYCGVVALTVNSGTFAKIAMPIALPIRPVKTWPIAVRAVSAKDGSPVVGEVIDCTNTNGQWPYVGGPRTTDKDGIAIFDLSDDRSYLLLSPKNGPQEGAFQRVTIDGDGLPKMKDQIVVRIPTPTLSGHIFVEAPEGGYKPLIGVDAGVAAWGKTGSSTWSVGGRLSQGEYRVYVPVGIGHYRFELPGAQPYSEYLPVRGGEFDVDASTKFPLVHDVIVRQCVPRQSC